ncbi:Octaprenyl-diphosphate synthase [Pseudoalteromonas luteoviolacea B = ATCC 29581]|nr:Octaprenyl-diphosphate synthase [Pseudoalteromonas luteoviolacea B = ATCC 29581]
MTLEKQIARARSRVERYIKAYFDVTHFSDPTLQEAMLYSLTIGGKRLRPFLVYATGELYGANENDLDVLAVAIECIHTYSLIHDDLPAMDDDDLRRGRATCHIEFDEATAILAGDALQTLAFELISNHQFSVPNSQVIKMLQTLTKATGFLGMAGGQAMDIAATGKSISLEQLETIHSLKTGALLVAAIELGALCSNDVSNEDLQLLRKYGKKIGLAFQVQDDILDIVGDTSVLGKPQGSDLELAKSTYPAHLGIAGAKAFAEQLVKQSIDALNSMSKQSESLTQLAHFIVERDH